MGNGFFGHSICKYTNGMNALCMVASITNVTTVAFDASNAARPSQDQGLNENFRNLRVLFHADSDGTKIFGIFPFFEVLCPSTRLEIILSILQHR